MDLQEEFVQGNFISYKIKILILIGLLIFSYAIQILPESLLGKFNSINYKL